MAPLVSRHARSVLAVVFVFGHLHAQPSDRYTARSWNVEHGLPQSSVRCITQTHDGYLWIGTWNGLARFDGVRLKSFNGLNTPELFPSIVDVYEDRRHRLWIATDGGGLLHYRDGTFHRVDTLNQGKVITFSSVVEDDSGRVWCASDDGVTVFTDRGAFSFTNAHGLPNYPATHLAPGPEGSMYLQFVGRILHVRFEGDSLRILEPPFNSGGYQIDVDKDGAVWYAVRGLGLVRRKDGREVVDRRFADVHPKEVYVLSDRSVWVLSPRGGHVLRDGNVEHIRSVSGIDLSNISTVFRDREGIVWIGVEGAGVIRLLPKQVRTITTAEGLETNSVMCGVEDDSGTMWIGTWLGGLARTNGASFDRVVPVPELSNGLTVMAVDRARDGTVWVGTWARGVSTIRNGRIAPFTAPGLDGSTSIRSIVRDREDGVWIAGIYGTVWHAGSRGTRVWDSSNGLQVTMINSMLVARSGEVWLGTDGQGIARISNGRVSILDERDGLIHNFAHVSIEDDSGSVWITSKRGIQRWKHGVLSTITARHGFDDDPAQFIQDDDGHYWIGGTHGIHRIAGPDLNAAADGTLPWLTFLTIGKADGMPVQEVSGGSNQHVWKTRSGMVWFSTTHGAVGIEPRKIASNPVLPGVIVEEVLVDHRPVPAGDMVTMEPEHSKIEFRYTGISFSSPEHIRFRYRLDGFDEAWRDAGRERYAQYTNLAPGEYTFRVTAANNAGIWHETGASVRVRVLPPFWATWWFRGLAVFFFLSVGPLIYWWRVSGLKREKAQQQEFSRRLIERQESERKRIAAELHDGLGQQLLVIKNRLLMSMQTPEAGNAQQSLAQISEVVGTAIEEVRSISHNLRPHQLDQLGLTKTLRAVVRQLRESTPLVVTAHLDDIDGLLGSQEEISLFRIVQEALNNISKHSGATEVSVSVRHEPGVISVEIADNGRGFDLRQRPNAEHFGTSFGLSGMAERAKMFGWEFGMDAAEGRGTTVRVRITRGMEKG